MYSAFLIRTRDRHPLPVLWVVRSAFDVEHVVRAGGEIVASLGSVAAGRAESAKDAFVRGVLVPIRCAIWPGD